MTVTHENPEIAALFKTPLASFVPTLFASEPLPEGLIRELVATMEVLTVPADTFLIRRGEPGEAMYVVLEGELGVLLELDDGGSMELCRIVPGHVVGEISLMLGGLTSAHVKTLSDSRLVRIPKDRLAALLSRGDAIVAYLSRLCIRRLQNLKLAKILCTHFEQLTPNVLTDFLSRARWQHLSRGETLYRQGEPGRSMAILVSGRLQVIRMEDSGEPKVLADLGAGEIVGEMSLLSGKPRNSSIYATRDSVLATYTQEDFAGLAAQHPLFLFSLTEQIIARLTHPQVRHHRPVTHIALVALDHSFPLRAVATTLASLLATHGRTLHLRRHLVEEALQLDDLAAIEKRSPRELRLNLWLDQQEMEYAFLLYEVEPSDPVWWKLCMRQAERVVWLASARSDPSLRPFESSTEGQSSDSRVELIEQELVLFHPATTELPQDTLRWLEPRSLLRHHHVRKGSHADLARVGRFLAGCAVGVVLGGGGARGAAHLGVFRALEKHDIPIDYIGGTSAGANAAALYAMGLSAEEIRIRYGEALQRHRPFRDIVLPLVSLLGSRRLDAMLQELFGGVQLEDLWLNCFAVSTNITKKTKVIHQRGPAWKVIRASSALPAIFPPFIEDGQLLYDGSILDSIPARVMRGFNPGPVILVDVSDSTQLTVPYAYEETPSPWRILGSWMNPLKPRLPVAHMAEVITESIMTSSTFHHPFDIEAADLHLTPPVGEYGITDFDSMREIAEIAYRYADQKLREWKKDAT